MYFKDTDKLKVNGWKSYTKNIYKSMPFKSKHKKTKIIIGNEKQDVMVTAVRKSRQS